MKRISQLTLGTCLAIAALITVNAPAHAAEAVTVNGVTCTIVGMLVSDKVNIELEIQIVPA